MWIKQAAFRWEVNESGQGQAPQLDRAGEGLNAQM
jgi:hypothetical protein